MAKKLILLLLIIPIVVMILLFAATKTVSNLVDVAVTGIDIIGEDRHVYLDMDKNETYLLEYAVYPTTAKNKNITVATEGVDGQHFAILDFDVKDGKITVIPKSAGAAKVVITTVDGGFKDSIIVYVDSTKLQSIKATVPDSQLTVGDSVAITTTYYPENPSNTIVEYVSSNPAVAEVTPSGVIRALSRGTATITVISDFDENITDSVTVTVRNKDAMDLGKSEIISFTNKGSIPISIASDEAITKDNLSYKITYENGNEVPSSVISAEIKIDGTSVKLDYTVHDADFVGSVNIAITFSYGEVTLTKTCSVSRVTEIEIAFDSPDAFGIVAGQTSFIPFSLTPDDANVSYSVTASNDNVTVRMSNNGRLVIVASKAGVTDVTLTFVGVDYPDQTKSITKSVVIKPKAMTVTETAKTYGIENLLTVGGYEYDYSTSPTGTLIASANGTRAFALHFSTPTEKGAGFAENVRWHSSSPEVLIDSNGVISFANDTFSGNVTFYASFSFGGVEERTGSYTVRCVADGINVYSYRDLYYAAAAARPAVLHTDVKDDFGYIDGNTVYTEIDTTYDKTYYDNVGRGGEAKVKVLLEFRDDLYGNGHIINAHNVTYKLVTDDKGNKTQSPDALFRGPLNFVMINEENGATVSVKAQDNICFALYEGVSVTNVELRGCDLESNGEGSNDLVDLNYIGTTVEVLGDDVTIAYSRLTNGRTVLRAFGDAMNSEKKINVTVTNSVLSGAREFIMKLGSNRTVNNSSEPSPNLPKDSGSDYNTKESYQRLSDAEKAAYDEKYINTFVTVRNSVFKDSGLFAIGMDSHFAGKALHSGKSIIGKFPQLSSLLIGWDNLASTSYGTKLTFEGDVGLYNWKDIEDVDSSTLIEITGSSAFNRMAFDVKGMIEKISDNSSFKNIITKYNGKQYVHAGIAFYGGGKNYSVFEAKNGTALNQYKISLSDVGRPELNIAAGDEPFYFFLYDATSAFTPDVQAKKLASGEAYDCIGNK